MDKVDVTATKRRIKQLEKALAKMGNEVDELYTLLDHWADYKLLIKGMPRPLPPTQWCVVCGNPIVSQRKAKTCCDACRQEAYRRRQAA